MCRVFDHADALLMGVVLWSYIGLELGLWGGVGQPAKLLINPMVCVQRLATSHSQDI